MKDLGLYDNDTMQHHDWTVFYDLTFCTASIEHRDDKKTIRLNQKITTQKQLSQCISVFWVAPENDRLFAGSPSDRRNFIHQLIEISNPDYGKLYNQYMHFIHERSQILRMPHPDSAWLDQLEQNSATLALQIYSIRTTFMETLNAWIKKLNHFHYHTFTMNDDTHDDLTEQMRSNRSYDQLRGGSKVGPHKSDLVGHRYEMPLHLCSNGQQCVGLLSILLGLVKQHSQQHPVLFLMDEIFSHLDKAHQDLLLGELKAMISVQTFITLPTVATVPGAQTIQL